MVNFLLGLHSGYTKYACFLYLWESRTKHEHWVRKDCLQRHQDMGDMGANMSMKFHFLDSHLDRFAENCGDVSDAQREWFHQDVKIMEEQY